MDAVKLCTDMHVPQGMNLHDFGVRLTPNQDFQTNLKEKCLNVLKSQH